MNQEYLIGLINKGEEPYLKFKEENIKANDFTAEIVSFANMESGIIIVGLSE